MAFRLRPRDTRLTPELAGLCDAVVEGARVLSEVVGADAADRPELFRRAAESDADAEEAMHAVLRELASALVTPIDRADVFLVAASLRGCSRAIWDASDLVRQFGAVPPSESIIAQLQFVQLAADVAAEAVPRFARHRVLTEAWIELSRLRKQSAARHRVSVAELTAPHATAILGGAEESTLETSDPVDPWLLTRVLQTEQALQEVMRSFDVVGHVLQQIVVKEG